MTIHPRALTAGVRKAPDVAGRAHGVRLLCDLGADRRTVAWLGYWHKTWLNLMLMA